MSKPPPKDKEEEEVKKPTSKQPIANCSIITGPTTIPTIAGPIFEWKCCVENLPKHRKRFVLLCV